MPKNFSATIKKHYYHPLNTGKLEDPTHAAEEVNSICGDEIKIHLKIENSKIENCTYEARGCMVTIAAASVLSEFIKGKTLPEIKKLTKQDIDKLLDVKISAARASCATLVLQTINKAVK